MRGRTKSEDYYDAKKYTARWKNSPCPCLDATFMKIIPYANIFQKTLKDALSDSLLALPHDSAKVAFAPAADLVLRGGKRIRPYLAAIGADDFSRNNLQIALELLHGFALVHDDIMDNSPLRRGSKTVHTEVGNDLALLSGDWLLMLSHEYFSKTNPHEAAQKTWSALQREVLSGQVLDAQLTPQSSMENVLQKTYLKTATYSVTRPLQLGLMATKTTNQQLAWAEAWGTAVGTAFQLMDDLLDTQSDSEEVGKPVLNDIMEGKATHYTAYAQIQKPEKHKAILDTKNIEQIHAFYAEIGAYAATQEVAQKHHETALTLLKNCPLSEKQHNSLFDLLHFLMNRTA